MNILVLTTLYPNNVQHRHGVFIENRVKELIKRYPDAKVKVVAPVPYFPSWLPIDGYKQYSRVVEEEVRSNIEVFHPKYLVIPKVGMNITPHFLYRTCLKIIEEIQVSGFLIDVIDSHYFYPDGVVASWIGKKLNIPVMVTARGSDINVIPENNIAKRRIVKALNDVQASAAVSKALADEMVKLAPLAKQPVVLRNGVDLEVFHPEVPRPRLPFTLSENEKLILSVGNLIELKGHHLIIDALKLLPKVKLIIIGEGILKVKLQNQVEKLNLENRVHFTGNIHQSDLPGYYASADALILASSREGMPNVLMESIACGTPAIATRVGGCKEVIHSAKVGELLSDRSSESIVKTLKIVLSRYFNKEEIQSISKSYSWKVTSEQQFRLLNEIAISNIKDFH